MISEANKLVVSRKDFQYIQNYINANNLPASVLGEASRLGKISEAEVLEESDFPWEVVRLNSKVIIRDKLARLNYTYTVVLPEEADHQKCKVSVFSPMGSAMFGYRRGDDIYWQTQKGKRYFTIMAISHNHR